VKRLALAATPIFSTVEPEPRHGSTLASLKPAPPTVIHLRDGEVVLCKRAGSPYLQVRNKLRTESSVRESTVHDLYPIKTGYSTAAKAASCRSCSVRHIISPGQSKSIK